MIPNCEGGTYDDGYKPGTADPSKKTKYVTLTINGVTYERTLTEKPIISDKIIQLIIDKCKIMMYNIIVE